MCIHSQKRNDFLLSCKTFATAYKLDLDSVKVNQNPKYLGQRSFHLKDIVWTHTHTHRLTPALPRPIKWLVKVIMTVSSFKHTHNRFTAVFPSAIQVSRCQKKSSSGLYGAREDNRGRHTDHPARRHSIWTNQRPTCIIPPFLCRMPLLPQPSHFILAWDRHQICWHTYPVVWLSLFKLCTEIIFLKINTGFCLQWFRIFHTCKLILTNICVVICLEQGENDLNMVRDATATP